MDFCRLETAYCNGLQSWIFGHIPWTDTGQNFAIHTPLLTVHDTRHGTALSAYVMSFWPPTELSRIAAVVVGLNREDVEWAKCNSKRCGISHGIEARVVMIYAFIGRLGSALSAPGHLFSVF